MSLKCFHKCLDNFAAAEQGFLGLMWYPLDQWLSSFLDHNPPKKYVIHCDPVLTHTPLKQKFHETVLTLTTCYVLWYILFYLMFLGFCFPKMLVRYTRGNGLLLLMLLGSQSWINQSCYFSFSSFLPYSICLAWFFPRSRAWGKDWNGTQVIYLGGDIRKQKREEG